MPIIMVCMVCVLGFLWRCLHAPFFKTNDIYFTTEFGSYINGLGTNSRNQQSSQDVYQEIKGTQLGIVKNETIFPIFNLENDEAYKIEVGSKIYTVDMDRAKERGVNYYGLLLETNSGVLYFFVPLGNEKNAQLIHQKMLEMMSD